ncbi:MAG: family 20 glycosylhydrolase [Eubacteriales bacterium]|nr:family 20 glycosylhydrolase [Eubacteriales bacterium]
MFTTEDIARIRAMVSEVTGYPLPQAQVTKAPGLSVTLHGGNAAIAAEDRNALARGFFLLARAVREGRSELDVHQERHFGSCGVMIDMSRNAVMTVEAVKRMLDRLAALGMNLALLYTEDTYEVPGYPYHGYLRGRYTQAELREIDDYAASLDIELMPCIQTLAHLENFLQWDASQPLQDKPDILQIDLEETYAYIEAAIASLRSCMRAKRIHIGMDEAHGVGLGQYYEKHGPVDRFELLNRHLARVCGICRQHDFHPMMWSDMFFRLGSKHNDYYDTEAVIPQSVIDMIPDVDLCYWDYYHMEESFYDHMLAEHQKMGRTTFAGGIWTWSGFLPQVKRTQSSMLPALQACARRQVDTVFATMWGDDGAETNAFLALNQLPIFSEACWQGPDLDEDDLRLAGECLTGLADEAFRAFGEFYPSADDLRPGKALIWGDLLYPLADRGDEPLDGAVARFHAAEAVLAKYSDRLDCRYARLCFQAAAAKGEVISQLRSRYLAGDRAWLAALAREAIPALYILYGQLMHAHRRLWERDMKRFGWEVLSLRYGAVMGRMLDVQDELERYLDGELDAIPELEEEPLRPGRIYSQFFFGVTTPTCVLK